LALAKFHLNDVGTIIVITLMNLGLPVNLSQMTVRQLQFRKPGAAANVIRTASLVTDGTDGKMQYTWASGDLDIVGIWLLMVYVESPTLKLHSDKVQFEVEANL
jgi:hypothetical protein